MSILRKAANIASASVVAFSSVLSIMLPATTYAAAQTCTWTGGGSDTKMSTAANWSGCGSAAPQTGDIVVLPYISTNVITISNDLPVGTELGGLTIDSKQSGGTDYGSYEIDKLAFADGAVINRVSGSGVAISDNVTAAGALTTNTLYPFYATTKNITVTPTNLTFAANTPSCGSGGAGSSREFEFAIKPTGQVDVQSGNVYSMSGTESAVTVAAGSEVILAPGAYAGTLTFNGGGATQGYCDLGYSIITYATSTLNGTINLSGGDIGYSIAYGKTLTVSGAINGTNAKLFGHANSAGTFINSAANNNSATPGGSQTVAMKVLDPVTDSQPTASLMVNANETVVFTGVRQYVTVEPKAVLKGTGTVVDNLTVNEGGTVAPGQSPGCLTSDTLSLSGTYLFELGGADACTGYDQLIVKNAASSDYGVVLAYDGVDSTSVLSTSRYNGYTPKKGQVFTIINQEGSKAVKGTFKDLPEGATFEQNGIVFKISYVGGDGNDVTLTVQNTPTTPDTGFVFMMSHPLFSGLALAILGLGVIGIARRVQNEGRNKKAVALKA